MGKPRKPIPELISGGLSEYFLVSGPDGILRVKDGRTLDEYLNDPRFVAKRKELGKHECVLVSREFFELCLLPRTA